ncbi:hypothetical protein C8F04DRAFT_639374 [Mycena alexandri]|uniref:Uncharacterized protein n=1 Tax=Mycena alexandri TaxID=1745969 RepID=A0AAD6SNU4_9AGAR|nr:hypothetical protein C8F04DRAFT_743863 [Mycena alexandri]KAJ7032873.1 hypothetical protein C8F04DRAFT_639374 [Mycena alexandri]
MPLRPEQLDKGATRPLNRTSTSLMPASNPKDRVTVISIREVPPHLSKEAFETNVRALADSLMALPVCKKNFLRYDLIFQTPSLDANLRALGFLESRPHVLSIAECESSDHWAEILADPEFARIVTEGEKFGFCSSARAFFADVATKIDSSAAAVDPTCLFAVFKAPTRLPQQEYFQKLDELVDRALALPICKKVFSKYSMHLPSNVDMNLQNIDSMLRALDLPAPEPGAVFITEVSSSGDLVELLAHPDIQKFAMEAMHEIEIHVNGVASLGNVEAKVKS